MRSKAKKFSHKLLALFLAVIMALTCFTGVITAYGATQGRYDDDVEYNSLAWSVLSDEQVATALLDYADEMLPMLKDMEPMLAELVAGADLSPLSLEWDLENRQVNASIIGINLASVTVKLGSVDELIETISSVDSLLKGSLIDVASSFGLDLGILTQLDLSSLSGMSRSSTSSCDIIRGVLGLLYDNNDVLFGNILRGTFSLGVIPLDIYDLLGGMLGLTADEAKDNFAYNIVQSLLFTYTDWFTPTEIENYKNGTTPFVFDEVLLEKMTVELLDKINVLVTYADGTSSATRKEAIDAKMASDGMEYEQAASALGYDPNLIYSTERGQEGNILLFAYGDDMIELTTSDSLFSFGYQALEMAWNTVLKDTIKLVHVNYDVDRGHGSNFDNVYYYWYIENVGAWDSDNLTSMYSATNVEAWADDVYASYDAESADEFLGWVQDNFVHDRTVAEDAEGNWSDIDSTTLFNKLRYSPLADYYFDMQTGPINLYFVQTGTDNLDAFFETNYSGYFSLVAGLNDCLVAAVKDIFPDSDNIYVDTPGDTARPTMATTGNFETINDAAIRTITTTLVSNTLAMIQYVADTADQNILNGFYKSNGDDAVLSEANLEEAMIPLLIACIGNVNLGSGRLDEIIHPADWDACKDAEAVAFVCLREYLSYILPNKDYNTLITKGSDGSINATLEGAILPMARDAVTYVMEGYVPVTDASGNAWSVKDRNVNDENTLLELLNSVICYYADSYAYESVDGNAMEIAPLLGVCNTSGDSLVTTENDIWTNFDNIANDLLPVLGTLQGKGAGNFDSEELIWKDIVLGVLDIDDTSIHASGFGGVSNFIYRLLTIISSDPIQSDTVVETAYELFKELINGLFGPRYTGQEWYPVPDATTSHPFDDLMQKGTLAGTDSSNVGAVQKLVNNFVEFSGYGYNGVSTYPDSILPGLAFAVTAVNSFVTIIPDLADHSLSMADAEIDNATVTGCTSGSSHPATITFTNNSKGVNIAYVDGMNDENVQLSRYYIHAKSATIEGPNASSTISSPSSALIAPGESITLNSSAIYSPEAGSDSCVYTITVTYDITDKNGTVLHSDLVARTYQYMTSAVSWADTVYPEDRIENGISRFPESLESDSANETKTVNGFSVLTTSQYGDTSSSWGSSNRFIVNYPEYITLTTDNLSAIDTYGVRVRNVQTGIFGSSKTLYGFYFYDDATVYDDRSASNVNVNSENAIPVFDKQTGDLLRLGLYDYSTDGGDSWVTTGLTEDAVEEQRNTFIQNNPTLAENFVTRTHVAYTLDQAYNLGLIAAAHQNERGTYDYVYMKDPGGDYGYHNVLLQISMRGPMDGFYLNTTENPSIANNNSHYQRFLQYDGSTSVQGTKEPIESKICFWHNDLITTATLKFVIADTSSASSVTDKLDELTGILDNYKDSDFTNPQALTVAKEAVTNALAAAATPVTPTSAIELNDTTERMFVTGESTSTTGDMAYTPIGSGDESLMPADILNASYFNEDDQLYYYDSEFVAPIYSEQPLTASDVSDGTDPAGVPVTLGEDGNYYYTNTTVYEREWDLETYDTPWYKNTTEQATDSDGNLLYGQIQFNHYNANGNSVRYVDDWVVKIPQTSYQLIENDGSVENRGIYTRANDYLQWTIEYVYDNLNTTIAEDLLDEISLVRNGMNTNNFDVLTYNTMVDIAKVAESQYTIDITYTTEEAVIGEDGNTTVGPDGETVTQTVTKTDTISFSEYNDYMNNEDIVVTDVTVSSNLSSVQVDEYIRLFDLYMSKVVERGYQGNQLEAEILCASGNMYANLTATPATYNEDGTLLTPAVVTKGASAVDPKFGAWSAEGTLVNEGETVYSAETWDAYVTALADAVAMAQLGNGSYAHKDVTNYDPTANDYDAQISDCYYTDTALQAAEIALEEDIAEPTGVSVTGSLEIASNSTGASTGLPVYGEYTVSLYADADRSQLVQTVTSVYDAEAETNTFALTDLDAGTYYASITSTYSIPLNNITVIVGDQDIDAGAITVVPCDLTADGSVTADDAKIVYSLAAASGELTPYADFTGEGAVTADDAKVVYTFAAGYTLPAVTIQ